MIDSTKHNYNIFKVIVILVLMCISHFSLLAQNPGDLIWESKVSHQYKWGLPLRLSMNSTDGTIYYGSSALNGKTGKLLWSSEKSPYRQFSVGKNYLNSFNKLENSLYDKTSLLLVDRENNHVSCGQQSLKEFLSLLSTHIKYNI